MPERIATTTGPPVKKVAPAPVKAAAKATPAPAPTTRRPGLGTPSTNGDSDERAPSRSAVIRTGWSGAHSTLDSTSDFASEFRPQKDTPTLIKFLQEGPFASYGQHWIERPGKKSFTCIGKNVCPLCHIGDKPGGKYCFNVLVFSNDEPQLMSWVVSGRDFLALEKKAGDPKMGPLHKHFWVVTKTGKGGAGGSVKVETNMVKERDVEEDWIPTGLVVPSPDELAWIEEAPATLDRPAVGKLHFPPWEDALYDASVIQIQTAKQLKEIADEISSEE